MIFQAEQQTVSWDLLALLQHFQNLVIIGVVGLTADIEQFLWMVTGEKFEMPADPSDCIHFSRRWKMQDVPIVDCCFMIRCCNRKVQWESHINDIVWTVLPHLLVVLESRQCNVGTVTQLCRSSVQLVRSITKVEQSMLVKTTRSSIDPNTFVVIGSGEQRINMFEEVCVTQMTSYRETTSFLESEQYDTLQLLQRCIKRNYFSVVNSEPVAHYYLMISLWTYFKRQSPPSDDLFGRSTKQLTIPAAIDVGALISIYLQVIQKEVRYGYKVRTQEYLKESREEFQLYQCLKQEKEMSLHRLKRYCYFLKAEKTKMYGRLCQFIKDTELELSKWNEDTNFRRNSELAKRCASNINYKMSKSVYRSSNTEQFRRDFQIFLEGYRAQCVGHNSGYALTQFLKQLIPQIYRYFDVAIKEQIKDIVEKRQQAVPQEGVQERITMAEDMLRALDKDIGEIQNRRFAIQKARKKNYKDSYQAQESLRQTREQIQKVKRLMSGSSPAGRGMQLAHSPYLVRPQKKPKKKKDCTLI